MGRSRFLRSYIELGKDGAGQDLIAHGDTAGAYLWWDASANKLKFMGGADMDFGSFGTPLVVNQANNYTLGIFGEVSVANSTGTNVERSIWSRLEVSAAQTGAFSIFGGQLQLRWSDGCATLGSGVENAQYGGAWLYLEQDTTGQALADYAHASGAVVQVETFGSLTIPTNAHLSGLQIESRLGAANGAAITNNSGTIAGLFITKSPAASGVTAQNWPYGIFIEDCDIGIHLESTQKIQFLDDGIFIHASVDGKLLISSDGGGADDITLSGGITLDANLTTPGKIILTRTDPTAAENGIYSVVNAGGSTGWTNSVAATRSRIYVTNTGVNIGNAYGGWFGVQFSTGMTASPAGLTCGIYAEAASEIAFTTPSSVAYFQSVSSADGNQTGMPILVLTSIAGENEDKPKYAIEFGYEPAATTVRTGSGGLYYNDTIQIKVNGSDRFIPLSTEEGTYTTAYPIVTSYNGDPSVSIGTNALPLTTATTGMSALKIWSDTTIDDTEYHVPLWVTSILKKTGGGTIYGIRAHVELGATFEADASGTLVGVHGRVRNQGTLSNSGTIMAGVMGQVLHGTGTHSTVSHIASIWADNQLRSDGVSGEHELIYMTNNNSGAGVRTIGQAIFLYGPYVTNFVNFNGCQTGGMVVDGGAAAEDRTGRIKISVNGATRYLYYYD